MPRPRSLTTAQLAAAALAVLDAGGHAGLTMRTVAAELGMSTMGLYRYVRDRDELERLVVDHVFDTVDPQPPPDGLPWRARVAELLERARAAFEAHPAVVPLTLTHRHRTPGALRWAESLLAVLASAGFAERERLVAVRALFGYLIGAMQLEHLGPLAGSGTRELAGLDDYPHIAANVRHAGELTPREEFAGGLAILLRGMDH